MTPSLTEKLTLERPVRVADGAGGFSQNWEALGVIFADIAPGSGGEYAQGSATVSRVSSKITVRAAPFGAPSRPKPEQRFRQGERIFRITAVKASNAGRLYLTCFADEEISS